MLGVDVCELLSDDEVRAAFAPLDYQVHPSEPSVCTWAHIGDVNRMPEASLQLEVFPGIVDMCSSETPRLQIGENACGFIGWVRIYGKGWTVLLTLRRFSTNPVVDFEADGDTAVVLARSVFNRLPFRPLVR